VFEAIKALEGADILTWVNRLIHVQYRARDLFGRMEPCSCLAHQQRLKVDGKAAAGHFR
jgi:hypothetical protein